MKPRRWYSSPELNPSRSPQSGQPFPTASYWAFTRLTHREQGAIIKSPAPVQPEPAPGRGGSGLVALERPRRINAA